MRKLNRSNCAILPLVLKEKWYDMIAAGKKREDYRPATPYWNKRIEKWRLNQVSAWSDISDSKWLVISFSRSNRKPDMFFLMRWCYINEIAEHPEWGEPSTPHWVLGLGEKITLTDGDI